MNPITTARKHGLDHPIGFCLEEDTRLRSLAKGFYYLLTKHNEAFLPLLHESSRSKEIWKMVVTHCLMTLHSNLSEELVWQSRGWRHQLAPAFASALLRRKENKPMIAVGKTQSGKSAVKAILVLLCLQLSIPTVIITTQCSECRDLAAKLKRLCSNDNRIFCVADTSDSCRQVKKIRQAISVHGVLIAASTHLQVTKMTKELKAARRKHNGLSWCLIMDEYDGFLRTLGGSQKFERALKKLRELGPVFTLMTTATPLPVWLEFCRNGMPFDNVMIEPSKEHVGFGVNDLNPLTSSDGQEVFLEQGELSVQCGSVHLESKSSHQPRTKLIEGSGESLFIREKRDHESVIDENGEGVWRTDVDLAIPYTNENVMLLYREALKHPKGVLIIDCTNPRVSVSGNVFEKASLVQNLFWREGFEVAVVVSVGDGISYRLAGVANGWCCAKDVTLGNAIERIDLQCGLETPVFVFGYHKLNRCVSVRSSQRVPTHICVHRGAATSIEDVFQTLGRGTGLFRNRLEENGFKNGVTILTTEADLQMFRRLAHFVEKVSASEDIGAIFEGRSVELPGSFDFLTCSRRIGKRKETRGNLEKIFKRQKAARSPALLLGPSGLGLARYDNVSLVHETQEKIIDLT